MGPHYKKLKFCFDLVTDIKLSYFMIVEGDSVHFAKLD